MERAEQKNVSRLCSQVSRAEARVAQAKSPTEKKKAKEKLVALRGRLAWMYLALNDRDKAQAQYQKMPTHDELRYYGMSCLYLQREQFEDADDCIDIGLMKHPHSYLLLGSRGVYHMLHNNYYEALECFDRVLEMNPEGEAQALPNKAHVLDEIGYLEEARRAWTRTVERHPDNGEYIFFLAQSTMKLGEFSSAAEGCREAILKGYRNSDVYELLCSCLMNLDQLHECETTALEAIRQYPEEKPMLYGYAGYALGCCGKYDEALNMMEKAIQLAPDDDFFKQCVVSIQGWKEDAEKAAQEMQEAASPDDPTNKSAIENQIDRADAYLQKREFERAVLAYETVPLHERTESWYACITQALIEQRRFAEAGTLLKKAIAEFQDSYCLFNNMGMRYYRDSKYKKAISFFEQAIAARSGENGKKESKKLLSGAREAYFNKALCLTELGRHQEAIDIYEKLLALNPAEASYHYELGYAYYCAKKTWLALGHLRLAYDLGLRTAGVYGGLCCAYAKAELMEQACQIAAEGLEKHPDVERMYQNAAKSQLELGEPKKARIILKQGLKRFPESNVLKKLMDRADKAKRGLDEDIESALKAAEGKKQKKAVKVKA